MIALLIYRCKFSPHDIGRAKLPMIRLLLKNQKFHPMAGGAAEEAGSTSPADLTNRPGPDNPIQDGLTPQELALYNRYGRITD